MRKFIIAATLLAAFSVQAETELVVHGRSHHTHARGNGGTWNQTNYGLGIRGYDADLSIQAGVYKNSIYKTSAYVMLDYTPLAVGPLLIGGFGGAVTGYNGGTRVGAGAVLRYQGQNFSVTLRAAPRFRAAKSGVLAVEVGFKF